MEDTQMKKPAPTDHEIHELIRERWSPRAFSSKALDERDLRSLLEAARWAASCFNEQPWRLIVARRDNEAEFNRLLSCLNEKNQRWAQSAAVLMISVASKTFAHSGKPNRHALHDVGLAAAQLTLQATAIGVGVHQMAGFSVERARELYAIPEDFEPVAAIAIGHPGNLDDLPEDLRKRERASRARRSQAEFVFTEAWGKPL
jgi:nitroreductase